VNRKHGKTSLHKQRNNQNEDSLPVIEKPEIVPKRLAITSYLIDGKKEKEDSKPPKYKVKILQRKEKQIRELSEGGVG